MKFEQIAILGGGLLGGSLVLRAQSSRKAMMWVRRPEAVAEAKSLGIAEATADLSEALAGAELVILAVPVGAMAGLVDQMRAAGLSGQTLVSDVGSVKSCVHRAMRECAKDKPLRFIGGHPMAGSEASGMQAACFDLFDRAACLLTDDQDVGQPWTDALEGFWRDVGCRVHWLSAADHDRLVARMSHLPHMMAALTARVGYRDPADGAFAGGGMRDTTRVAAGDPAMWAEILLENREAVIDALGPVREWLTDLHGMLERGDERAMRDWLTEARRLHAAGSEANEFPDS